MPDEDQGYFFLNVQLPDAASLQRTDAVCRKVEAILAKTEGVAVLQHGRRLQPALATCRRRYNGFFFVSLKPWDERERRRSSRPSDRRPRSTARSAPRSRRRRSFAFLPPAIPGLGTAGGFSLWLQDRSGGSVDFLDQNLQKFLEAARKRPELAERQQHLPRRGAAGLRRRRPRQGAEAGRADRRRLPDAAGVPRRLVRQPVQPLRPAVARLSCRPRARSAREPEDIGQFYVRNNDGNMVPLSALTTIRTTTGPEYTKRFNLYRAAAGHRRGGARLQLGPGARRARGGGARRRCRARWATTGPTSRIRRRRRRARTGRVFALSLIFVFLILAALYESWSLPFSVLLSVPVAVFGAFLGLLLAQVRLRRLRADRPRHADRPRGQERDPDRRVRQGGVRRRGATSSTRRWRARGCACGRS